MKLKFARTYDVTQNAAEMFKDRLLLRTYICQDVNDYHVLRIFKDTGEYGTTKEGTCLVEHAMINRDEFDFSKVGNLEQLMDVLNEAPLNSYDEMEFSSLAKAITHINDEQGIFEIEDNN